MVVMRTDVGDIGLSLHQLLYTAKITKIEDNINSVHHVVELDAMVTHTLGVDVGQALEDLVHVHLDIDNRDG
jgi:hypothetical protein